MSPDVWVWFFLSLFSFRYQKISSYLFSSNVFIIFCAFVMKAMLVWVMTRTKIYYSIYLLFFLIHFSFPFMFPFSLSILLLIFSWSITCFMTPTQNEWGRARDERYIRIIMKRKAAISDTSFARFASSPTFSFAFDEIFLPRSSSTYHVSQTSLLVRVTALLFNLLFVFARSYDLIKLSSYRNFDSRAKERRRKSRRKFTY